MLLLGFSGPQNTDQHGKQADPSRAEYGFILVFWPRAVFYVSSAVVLLVTASAVKVGRKAAFL